MRATAAGLLVLSSSGCGALQQSCSAVGCTSVVSIDVSPQSQQFEGATARLCVQDRCESRELSTQTGFAVGVRLGVDNTGPDAEFSTDAPLPVHLVITKDGSTLLDRTDQVTLTRVQPNGERCDPTCWWANLLLTGDALTTAPPVQR